MEKVIDQYEDKRPIKTGHWCTAFHGTHLASLHSILGSGRVKESISVEDGDDFLQGSPGAYCHGHDPDAGSKKAKEDNSYRAEHYSPYWSPLDNGQYYCVKIEMEVDRERGTSVRKEQWVQPTDSCRITGLWIKAVTWKDIPCNSWFTEGWNPKQEANLKRYASQKKDDRKDDVKEEKGDRKDDTESKKG